ncbi:MAG TPA: hypothetical protein VG845_01360, partial [Dehalococcoidia bacterium]|nr:hypothetical protein [Dehalococcoidia bacterium]
MSHATKQSLTLVLVATLAFAIAACGGKGAVETDQSTSGSDSDPKSAGSEQLPRGWKSFQQGPYAGGVHGDWIVGSADLGLLIDSNSPEIQDMPPALRAAFAQGQKSGIYKDVVIIWLDFNAVYPTNIQLGPCLGSASEVSAYVGDPAKFVEIYRALGIKTNSLGLVPFGN